MSDEPKQASKQSPKPDSKSKGDEKAEMPAQAGETVLTAHERRMKAWFGGK